MCPCVCDVQNRQIHRDGRQTGGTLGWGWGVTANEDNLPGVIKYSKMDCRDGSAVPLAC